MGRGVFKRVIQGQGAANRSNDVRSSEAQAPNGSEKKDGAPAPHTDIVNATPPIIDVDAAEESAASSRPKDDAHKREAAYSSNEPRDVTHDKPYQTKLYGFPVVYGDVEVCRMLRIRRRIIAAARTKQTRGVDWDCVGLHAGMTMKWIEDEALRRGIVPDFFGGALKPIKPDDGVVSCKLLGTWPNRQRVTVEVVATGEAKVATVPNADLMHLYEIFDCRTFGSELQWTAELNDAAY